MRDNVEGASTGILAVALSTWLAACGSGQTGRGNGASPGTGGSAQDAAGSGPASDSGGASSSGAPSSSGSRSTGAAGSGTAGGSGAGSGAGGTSEQADAGDQDAGPLMVAPTLQCEAITTSLLALPQVEITQSTTTAAQAGDGGYSSYPTHCLLTGKIAKRTGIDGQSYAIGFELRLPLEWNRRFYFQGGGGADGFILPALGVLFGAVSTVNALSLGYAVVATDGGHTLALLPPDTGGALFGVDPQARIDYGYNAVGTVTHVAKQIIERVYGVSIRRSYFMGCSNGGRQAMVAAARFADEYDGIVVGDPGFDLPKAAIQHAWDAQQLNTVNKDNSQAFTADELTFVSQQILAKCDALDGATDGIVTDFDGCKAAFDLGTAVPPCSNGVRTGACLTPAQKRALAAMTGGPINGQGQSLYSDWPWDPSISTGTTFGDWRTWKLGTSSTNSLIRALGAATLAYVFTTPPVQLNQDALGLIDAPGTFLANYDFDVDAPKINATQSPYDESSMSFMTPPDPTHLDEFRKRHGKLLVFHGSGDPVFSLYDTIRWYKELGANVGDASDFVRLYVVPGMGHCFGGISTEVFDVMTPLVSWVEKGTPPSSLQATVDGQSKNLPAGWSKSRSRPLCPYPQKALLAAGATDLESAASFVCK